MTLILQTPTARHADMHWIMAARYTKLGSILTIAGAAASGSDHSAEIAAIIGALGLLGAAIATGYFSRRNGKDSVSQMALWTKLGERDKELAVERSKVETLELQVDTLERKLAKHGIDFP